ncbi:VOC family protein [Pseudonocardia halophobica]|uniref:Glyoxalase n=1 Tax=Pseudonocardia halophobica TaxID=29401 RepID=A0A9W6P1H4_9PSEU|nr:VOC family protein [Pseudonocardia halophobica]GLL16062.1 glyoxalase [Pseudonocardia halophobica]
MPELTGVRCVKLPVADLPTSVGWYRRVYGFAPLYEFPDENGVVRGVAGDLPGGGYTGLALREIPGATGVPGFEVMLGVRDRAALEGWVAHLDEQGAEHSPIVEASVGWLVVVHDPDGHEHHLYTDQRHGIDQSGRAGYGRAVADPA